ncbi:unnamed protein product, partial [Aphanomyces euteiches]
RPIVQPNQRSLDRLATNSDVPEFKPQCAEIALDSNAHSSDDFVRNHSAAVAWND